MNDLASELASIVGDDHVLLDRDVIESYEQDWTGRFHGNATAVVRPANTGEASAVVSAIAAARATIVPQGGNTGLVGGGVPRNGKANQVIVSTRRLNAVGPVDADAMQVTAGSGTTIEEWQEAARSAGLDTPIDFAARGSATIGGAISTNAGGSRVVRFGTMRQQVVGIEAVLADGSVVGSLAGLPKETAGWHWPSALSGAEGTLGLITNARLRLVPWFRHTATAMVALGSIDAALALLRTVRSDLRDLDSIEIMQPDAVALVADHLGHAPPVDMDGAATVLTIDVAGHADPTDNLADVLAGASGILASAVTAEPGPREALLAFRDRLTEAIAAAAAAQNTPVFKLDVAVPVDKIRALLEISARAAADDGCRLIAFGHLAEGNLHLNHLGARDTTTITATVLTAVAEMGGTISAEHGIGVAKAPWLGLIRDSADLAAQGAIASALDPRGIFNPGVLGR